jgi:hypothetical protein
VRPFFTAALGYEAFGDTDAVDPLRCGAAARRVGRVGRLMVNAGLA